MTSISKKAKTAWLLSNDLRVKFKGKFKGQIDTNLNHALQMFMLKLKQT